MKEKEFTNPVETLRATSLPPAATEKYTAPNIEVIDIELENMFAASPESDGLQDLPGEGW